MHKLSNIVSRFRDIPLTRSDTRSSLPPPQKKKPMKGGQRGEIPLLKTHTELFQVPPNEGIQEEWGDWEEV